MSSFTLSKFSPQNQRIAIFAALGFIAGLVIYALLKFGNYDYFSASNALQKDDKFILYLIFFLSYFTAFFFLCFNHQHPIRLIISCASIAALNTLLIKLSSFNAPESASLFFALFFIFYLSLPFVQTYQQHGTARFAYKNLFLHSWNNPFITVLAHIFLTVFFLLLTLWSSLFQLIKIDFFSLIFKHETFLIVSFFVMSGVGIAILREADKTLGALRKILLALCKVLTPIVAVTMILFLAFLPITGMENIWALKQSGSLFIGIIATFIFFFNGVYQEGEQIDAIKRWYKILLSGALIAMPFFACFALYALSMRIEQYGITPLRYWGLVCAIISACYAFSYAIALFIRSGTWLGAIKPINTVMALVIIAVLVLTHMPYLNATETTIRSQLSHLYKDVGKFDYATLQYDSGKAGREALQKLLEDNDHPEAALMHERIREVQKYDSRYKMQICTAKEKDESHAKLYGCTPPVAPLDSAD